MDTLMLLLDDNLRCLLHSEPVVEGDVEVEYSHSKDGMFTTSFKLSLFLPIMFI